MTHPLAASSAILALLLAAGLALAAAPASGDQIRAALAGNTVQGAMEASGVYGEYYAADGTIRSAAYMARWTVEGDAMCFDYGDDPQACWQVVIDGDQITWLKDGKVEGRGTILPGNPNGW